ncbi:Ig-like domain-containing protein [Psychrobacter sp. AH5]|uniref:Ig-like domain-containing protein n=1 Tax=Psychrobacter sp. AH5 TaxID=2937433 RepID=UPI003341C461
MSYGSLTLSSKLFNFTALSLALTLAGCGGGDGGTDILPPKPNTGVTQPGGGGGGPVIPVNEVNITPVTLLDNNGNPTRVISTSSATARVKVTNADGNGLSGALVTFNGSGVKFGTSNGAVLTNGDGIATTSLIPLSAEDTGSYSLSATANYNGISATSAQYNYSLQPVKIALVNLTSRESNIDSGASTIITLQTRDTGTNQFQNDVTVNFSTTCGSFEVASVTSSNQGSISTIYKAIDSNGNLCEGRQTITAATANNSTPSRSITVNVRAIAASSIVYTTNENIILGAKNSGSSSSGQVEFTVYANGVPASNQQVELSLVKSPSDFRFISQNNRNTQTVKSDASGKVTINLYPGNIPGPVEISAALSANKNIFAFAKNIAVATGRPSQSGITLALGKNVLVDNFIDSTSVSVYLTDRQGNFVPDGTVVSFVSEGGTITPNCATSGGNCSVTFTSQNPRPANGRVSVIAYVEGDKDYSDLNGDNVYTAGVDKLLDNIGYFFRDDNEDLKFNPGEFVYRRGEFPTNVKAAECATSTLSQPNLPNFIVRGDKVETQCNDSLATVLRKQVIMGFANDTPTLTNYNFNTVSGVISFEVYGNSMRTVPMPSGTTFSLQTKDNTENEVSCEPEIFDGNITLPRVMPLRQVNGTTNQNFFAGTDIVSYEVSTAGCANGDEVKLTVTTPAPSSKTTTFSII